MSTHFETSHRRIQTVVYRRWCPQASPIAIEFRPELPKQLRAQSQRETSQREEVRGFLFGLRNQNEYRILSVRSKSKPSDPSLSDLQLVGICVCRERGEVFLTDADLVQLDQYSVAFALVIAGDRAGFFVRQADGTIQAVRSYEEFPVSGLGGGQKGNVAGTPNPPQASEQGGSALPARSVGLSSGTLSGNQFRATTGTAAGENPESGRPSAPPVFRHPSRTPRPPVSLRHPALGPRRTGLWSLAILSLLALPIGAVSYLSPLIRQAPLELTVNEAGGQIVINWDPRVTQEGGRLEIVDQGEQSIIQIPADAASATYAYRGNEVELRLSAGTRAGMARWGGTRFVTAGAGPGLHGSLSAPIEQAREQIQELEAQVAELRESLGQRQARLAQLTRQRDDLVEPY